MCKKRPRGDFYKLSLCFHWLKAVGFTVCFGNVAAAAAKSLQSCPTLSDPMNCSLPGSSVHGIFQARVLEWVAIAFSGFKWILRKMSASLIRWKCTQQRALHQVWHLVHDSRGHSKLGCWPVFLWTPSLVLTPQWLLVRNPAIPVGNAPLSPFLPQPLLFLMFGLLLLSR